MPKLEVYNLNREKVGDVDLADAVFGVEVREHLFHAAVRYQLAKRRAGTHSTKGRAEVSGGGKKPWRQKGTGRARQGTRRAPQWRGGGVVHGPRPRSHAHGMNKSARREALKAALSRRCEESAITVVDSFELPEIKTKQVVSVLERFELDDMLLVLGDKDDTVFRSARNIPGVHVLPVAGLNVYDILKFRNLVMTQDAVAKVVARLGE